MRSRADTNGGQFRQPLEVRVATKERTMQVEGITWHGLTFEHDKFTAMKKLCSKVFCLAPMIEEDGWTLFAMPNGTMLDLFEPDSKMIPSYGLNGASCSASV
jgi:hypothetical protein